MYQFETIADLFYHSADKFKAKASFLYKRKGEFIELSFSSIKKEVELLALAFEDLSLEKGDRVGILAENRIEWITSSFALSIIGCIDVPLFPIQEAKQVSYAFNHSEVKAVIVSTQFQLKKLLSIQNEIESLKYIIVMQDISAEDLKNYDRNVVKTYSELLHNSASKFNTPENLKNIRSKAQEIQKDDILCIIYTSGTTGEPKGVTLTHNNVASNAIMAIKTNCFKESDVTLCYLPLCHAYERTIGFYSFFAQGVTIGLAESVDTIISDIQQIKPTLMTTVPKLLETVRKKTLNAVQKDKGFKKDVFNWAFNIGKKYINIKLSGNSNAILSVQYKIADKVVFSKIREKLGGKLKLLVAGGAALQDDVNLFFLIIGINAIQGYGLTEASPVCCVNLPWDIEIGTIGTPLTGCSMKLDTDGEILVKGPHVMKGYWKNEKATKECIDENGWLKTGDIGIWTEKGHIKITDRKKNIFVSSGGKNIAPAAIEDKLRQSTYIDQIFMIGENREFNVALIVPDFEQLKYLANQLNIKFENIQELLYNQSIIKHIHNEIDNLQTDFSKYERIRKFSLLKEAFSISGGELSPKLSVRRHLVEEKYKEEIARMYK